MISKLKNPYLISQIASSGISILLLPIVTRIMPQDEVGNYAEIMSFAFFVSVFIKFGSHQAVLVFLNETKEKIDESREFSGSFAIPFINFLITSVVLIILAASSITPWIYLIAGPYALVDVLHANRLNYFRYKDFKLRYLCNTLTASFMVFALTILSLISFPTGESRFIAVVVSFAIVNIIFYRQAPRIIPAQIFKKDNYLKYMNFGVWLALMWLVAEFFNWFIIKQISKDLGLALTGRFSVMKTIFYQSPSIFIIIFDLVFIDKYYKKGQIFYRQYISKYLIALVAILLTGWIFSISFERQILIFISGDENYFRDDFWLNVIFATLICRALIFKPLYDHYRSKQTRYVFYSYFLSYLAGFTAYNFFHFEITISFLLIPMFCLNIFLRFFKHVKI